MKTLHRALTASSSQSTALPLPFRTWADQHITVRRGEVTMIAGPPGVGKSSLALTIAVRSNVPTLYVSCDTHAATMGLRTVSLLTGIPQFEVEHRMSADPSWAAGVLREGAEHVRWAFDPAPSLQDLEDIISCYRTVMGEDAVLWVIDNAVDVTLDSGDEFAGLRSLMRELKWWARDMNAAALVLHHTSEAVESRPCPPRSAIHGKISQVPAVVLTLGAQEGLMAVCPVKNRYGRADASGGSAVWMQFVPDSMTVRDAT